MSGDLRWSINGGLASRAGAACFGWQTGAKAAVTRKTVIVKRPDFPNKSRTRSENAAGLFCPRSSVRRLPLAHRCERLHQICLQIWNRQQAKDW